MFLHLSVNPFTVGCLPWVHGGCTPSGRHPPRQTPPGQIPPPRQTPSPATVDILLEYILVKNCISNLADLTDLLIVKMTQMFHSVICRSKTWTLQTLATEKRWIIKTIQDINYVNKAMTLKMCTRKYDNSWRIDSVPFSKVNTSVGSHISCYAWSVFRLIEAVWLKSVQRKKDKPNCTKMYLCSFDVTMT